MTKTANVIQEQCKSIDDLDALVEEYGIVKCASNTLYQNGTVFMLPGGFGEIEIGDIDLSSTQKSEKALIGDFQPFWLICIIKEDLSISPLYVKYITEDEGPTSIDVSPDGETILFVIQCDDFFEIISLCNGEITKFDCSDLIDTPAVGFRYNGANDELIGPSVYEDGNWLVHLNNGIATCELQEYS